MYQNFMMTIVRGTFIVSTTILISGVIGSALQTTSFSNVIFFDENEL